MMQMMVWRLEEAPFPAPRKFIITIPIPIYRGGDGDDVEEGGGELHPKYRSALEAIRGRWRGTNSNPTTIWR
jgi:hypothetical protein